MLINVRSVSGVDKSIVFKMILVLHIFIKLVLSVKTMVQGATVDLLDVETTDSSRAFCLPFFDFAVGSNGYLVGGVQSWLRILSLLLTTQSERFS